MRLFSLSFVLLLSACSTTPKWLENRVACTVDKREAHFISKWGMFGVGSEIAKADAEVICGKPAEPK